MSISVILPPEMVKPSALEVTVAERGEQGVHGLPLTARIDGRGRRRALDPPAGPAGQLAGRSRGPAGDAGDVVELGL